MIQPRRTWNLVDYWHFRQACENTWLPAQVPSTVHLDLMHHDKIKDPFLDFNELKCQWVAEQTWLYRTVLPAIPSPPSTNTRHVLAFDGLDTIATVTLNGTTILTSDNMFIPHRVDITSHLFPSLTSPSSTLTCPTSPSQPQHTLQITFRPALTHGRTTVAAHPKHKWLCSNGEPGRLAVRKAQYHYGWDWGPVLMTCGPWKAVRLEAYESRLADLVVTYDVEVLGAGDGGSVGGRVEGVLVVEVEGMVGEGWEARFEVGVGGERVFEGVGEMVEEGRVEMGFCVAQARLWWPRGYGEQVLHEVKAVLVKDGCEVDKVSKRIGFRKGELVQDYDEIGRSFYFRFNGVDVFCGGSCWIPADSFTPRITADRYRQWIQTLVDGNQSMIRIWGGGIWEDDAFYDICDEYGILVWQDFMFACGNYPTYPSMLKSIEEEAVAQLKRLRHHPCVAIYAGNNEDYQIAEQNGLTYDYDEKNPEKWLESDFPARYVYEKLLPDAVEVYSPHVPYHPGSPWGDGKPTSDQTVGDMHQWNVWHGTQQKYQVYDTLGGRFNSEFGLEAFPHLSTIESFVSNPAELYPQSHTLDFHNKADGHERRIATYLVENFRTQTKLDRYIHLTQLSQSEAMTYGYRGWRKQWGEKRRCGGALVWQLNDCWPVTSWSIVDYYLKKKPAWYAIKRASAPLAVAVKREHHDWSVTHARAPKTSRFDVWVVTTLSKSQGLCPVNIEVRFISIASGKEVRKYVSKCNQRLNPNGTTNILHGSIDNENEEPFVIEARMLRMRELVSQDHDWPQPLKYLDFSDRGVDVTVEGDMIHVKVDKPTKGLVFQEQDGVTFDDNAIDVMPRHGRSIEAKGLTKSGVPMKWTYLDAP